jgi:restriction system protein
VGMAVPAFHQFLHPLLEVLSDGKEYRVADVYERLADHMSLTAEDRAEVLPSGKQRRYANRIGWAKTYLTKASLLDSPRRGSVRITERGRQVLQANQRVDLDFLQRFEGFQAFRDGGNAESSEAGSDVVFSDKAAMTPDERLDKLIQGMNRELARDLLDQLWAREADFFEHVVVRLLVMMGYGGSIADAGKAVGRSGDGGIDGIIKQDRLGLDNVYVQAKRYAGDRTVGAGEVRNLAGALQMRKATKGVLITTSSFTKDAIDTARQIGTIVLVDGEQLAQLMIEYDLGVATEATYALKKVDQDFFDEWA